MVAVADCPADIEAGLAVEGALILKSATLKAKLG
jgi:hypothetical protein